MIPIHDHLHWSLALLCFLGEDGWAKGAGETGVCCRRAFLLHLDSMSCATPVSSAPPLCCQAGGPACGRQAFPLAGFCKGGLGRCA